MYLLVYMRQEDGHLVGAVAIGQLDGLIGVVVGIDEFAILVHHRYNGIGLFCIGQEFLVFRLCLVELVGPGALEVDGIQQIADGIGIER